MIIENFIKKIDSLFEEETAQNVLYVLRGVPGSGKSTYVKNVLKASPENIFSTDNVIENEFAPKYVNKSGIEGYRHFFDFMQREKRFDLMGKAHNRNLELAKKAIDQKMPKVIIDNTNLEPWESKPYVQYALDNEYEVKIINIPLKNTAEELVKRNVHGVPLVAIERMIDKYKKYPKLTVDQILNSQR